MLFFTRVKGAISPACFFVLVVGLVIVRLAREKAILLVTIRMRKQREQLETIEITVPVINLISQLYE